MLAVVTSCSKDSVEPIEDYQATEMETEMETPEKECDDYYCSGLGGGWAPPQFSVNGGEVFENKNGIVRVGIGAEGGIITFTHIGGMFCNHQRDV